MNWFQWISWYTHSIFFPLATPTIQNAPPPKPTPSANAVFDDFDGPAGSTPDPALWTVPVFPAGNPVPGIAQPSPSNVAIDGSGHLVITATQNAAGVWTAGWLASMGIKSFGYGTFSASIKMPAGAGLDSAFWLMGQNYNPAQQSTWPACGEIDIIEYLGTEKYYSTIHGPVYNGPGNSPSNLVQLVGSFGFDPSQGFHTYWCKHAPGSVTFGIDGTTINTLTPANIPDGSQWACDQPFSVLFDIGVGINNYPGPPNAQTAANAAMLVDWFLWEPAQ